MFFAAWLAVCAIILITASVPAFSPPWTVPATPPRFAVIEYWWPWLLGGFLAGSVLLRLPFSRAFQSRSVASIRETLAAHPAVVGLLIVATLLRFGLVMRGGQYFDWDEVRYGGSATWMFAYVSTGQFRAALDMLLRSPDHPGFRIVGLPLAFFHVASAWRTGRPITEMRFPTGEWLPVFLLSLSAVCAIGLTYAIAIRAGASRRESTFAAFLMSASTSMIIYTQHFFPYDAAMALLLFALWAGINSTTSALRSFAIGSVCGAAFLTYEGYWLLTAAVVAIHVLQRSTRTHRVIRAFFCLAGLSAFPLLLLAAGHLAGRPFLEATERFSRSAVNGDFSEGWSLPWEYFWHTEHGLLVVFAFGIAACVFQVLRGNTQSGRWLATLCSVYAGLIAGSNVFHRFVVYDRLAREMLPFMCLTAAAGMARIGDERLLRGMPARVLYAGIFVMFILNTVPLAMLRYPRDVALQVARTYGSDNIRVETTVLHSDAATEAVFLPFEHERTITSAAANTHYVLINAKDIWVPEGASEASPPPAGHVLLSTRHPRQLKSLQYHGYRTAERAFLRRLDLSIKLIDTAQE